jgi:hypothetical protein
MEFLQTLGNDDTKEHRRTGFKRIFGYFGQNLQDRGWSSADRKTADKHGQKPMRKMLAEGLGELPPLCIWPVSAYLRNLFSGKRLSGIGS